MDPLSALAIAASVVQFIDFTSKIFKDGYAAYKSVDGASDGDINLQALVSDLGELSVLLATPPPDKEKLSQDEISLRNLARKCSKHATELSLALERLRVQNLGIWRSWTAFRKSVERVMKNSKLQKMKKELDDIRSQVVMHMMNVVKNSQSALISKVDALTINAQAMHIENSLHLDDMKQALLNALRDHMFEVNTMKSAEKEIIAKARRDDHVLLEASQRRHDEAIGSYQQALTATLCQLENFGEGIRETDKIFYILKSLEYDEMPLRHRDIHEAYVKSLHWAYSHDAGLAKWLSQGTGLFWISGKAGSGKSTLMKYLVENQETQSLLGQWAGGPVYLVKFYFWNAGYPMQKTQQGLLQSLLLQILRKCPQLVPECFPTRWAALVDFDSPVEAWNKKEMLLALQILLQKELPMSFCLFIDGLDEFEMSNAEGDHYDLVQSLAPFEQSRCFKLCVSSRPWKQFSDAYKVGLRVQDWNREDIDKYVRGLLEEDARFKRIAKADDGQKLISQIIDNAQGVFLWVWLVVRALLHGLSMHDDILTLQRRLDALPKDLKTYFQHMLDKVEDVYSEHAACLMQLAIREQPLTVLALSYIPKELTKPGASLRMEIRAVVDSVQDAEDARAEIALNQWCRDMLEIRGSDLVFLHRTVKDFLETPDVQQTLVHRTAPDFDPWRMLLQLYLYEAKTASQDVKHFLDLAGDVLSIAQQYEIHRMTPADKVIAELDRVGKYFETAFQLTSSWTAYADSDCTLMAMAVSFGLIRYVRQHLVRADDVLLDFALRPRILHRRLHVVRPADVDMIQLLLEKGANPNGIINGAQPMRTPWTRFLSSPGSTFDDTFVAVVTLLIEHGADLKAKIWKGKKTLPVKRGNYTLRNIEADDFRSVEESLTSHCNEQEQAKIRRCVERREAQASQTMLGALSGWLWSRT